MTDLKVGQECVIVHNNLERIAIYGGQSLDKKEQLFYFDFVHKKDWFYQESFTTQAVSWRALPALDNDKWLNFETQCPDVGQECFVEYDGKPRIAIYEGSTADGDCLFALDFEHSYSVIFTKAERWQSTQYTSNLGKDWVALPTRLNIMHHFHYAISILLFLISLKFATNSK